MIRALALATALIVSVGIAAADAMTPAQYARSIGDAAQGLERAAEAGNKQSKALARAALDRVPQRATVRTNDGAIVGVDNRELLRGLGRQVGTGRNGIRTAARVLRNLEHSVSAPRTPAPADARVVLARVLRGGDFKPSRIQRLQARILRAIKRVTDAVGRVIDRVEKAIGRALEPLIRRIPNVGLPREFWRSVAIVVLAITVLIVIYLIVRLVLQMLPREGPPARRPAPEPLLIRPHTDWLADAESALRGGDYRSAMRALHMAALMRLDEGGFIRYVDSRTDGRFTRALRDSGRHDLAETLSSISGPFAAVWYGAAPARPGDYLAAHENWKRLETLAAT